MTVRRPRAELLPISGNLKQGLLELDDPILALAELERAVHAMQEEARREE